MKAQGTEGQLTLRTQLSLTDMLRPAVQPGSTLDHEFPPETVSLAYDTFADVKFTPPDTTEDSERSDGHLKGSIKFAPKRGQPIALEIALNFRRLDFPFSLAWFTAEDKRPRPFPLHRALMPWADVKADVGNLCLV